MCFPCKVGAPECAGTNVDRRAVCKSPFFFFRMIHNVIHKVINSRKNHLPIFDERDHGGAKGYAAYERGGTVYWVNKPESRALSVSTSFFSHERDIRIEFLEGGF